MDDTELYDNNSDIGTADRPTETDIAPSINWRVTYAAAIANLEARIDELEAKIEELDAEPSSTSAGFDTCDHRDRAVLERLEPGTAVTIRDLRRLYKQHTDIKSKETLVERLRSLTDRPEFQSIARQKYRYVPEASK